MAGQKSQNNDIFSPKLSAENFQNVNKVNVRSLALITALQKEFRKFSKIHFSRTAYLNFDLNGLLFLVYAGLQMKIETSQF